jgi:hypothetical protein
MTTAALPPDLTPALNLAEQINAAYTEARGLATHAATHAREAVTRALACGTLLNQQKATLAHGDWQPWLAAHCPAISFPTARRYMKLAKQSHATLLTDAAGLRQAYIATGVLAATPRTRPVPDAHTATVGFVRPLDQFRRWFNTRVEQDPIDHWPPEARRLLRNELNWFAQLHRQLARDPTPTAQVH